MEMAYLGVAIGAVGHYTLAPPKFQDIQAAEQQPCIRRAKNKTRPKNVKKWG
jgi:hypothetical protein